jgi:hypothetical protein
MPGNITLTIEDDDNLLFSDNPNVEKPNEIIVESGKMVTLRNKKNASGTGYGKIVATTYVWVKNNRSENISDGDRSI